MLSVRGVRFRSVPIAPTEFGFVVLIIWLLPTQSIAFRLLSVRMLRVMNLLLSFTANLRSPIKPAELPIGKYRRHRSNSTVIELKVCWGCLTKSVASIWSNWRFSKLSEASLKIWSSNQVNLNSRLLSVKRLQHKREHVPNNPKVYPFGHCAWLKASTWRMRSPQCFVR